jgi:hypothetical protein
VVCTLSAPCGIAAAADKMRSGPKVRKNFVGFYQSPGGRDANREVGEGIF